MINLLQVELKKIFKKKSIYVIWLFMLIFCVLNNILYYTDYDEDGNYKYFNSEKLDEEKNNLEFELKKYNKEDVSEVTMYITLKTKIDIFDLQQQFLENSWQYKNINNYLYDVIYQINYYQFVEENHEKLIEYQEQYTLILNKLVDDDYQYFLNLEIQKNIDEQKYLKELYKQEFDLKNKKELEEQIEEIDFNLKLLSYRLNNNIKNDNSYLNKALEAYCENYRTLKYYNELGSEKTYQERLIYQEALSEVTISKYIVENQQNINKQNSLNYQLRTIIEDYEIFIVMLILIVCSTIICNEFKDGTIKLLLIKPYSRCKILLSKYFTSIIVVVVTILLLIITQIIIGGFIFGFDSLSIPVVVYNFNKSKLIEYSIFQYMTIRIIAKVPFLIMLLAISLFLGVVTNNVIISITMPLILYMFSPTMSYLMVQYQLNFMKYLVNINWNMQDYLFGNLPGVSFISFWFSVSLLLIYFIILLILTFCCFKKKNIKNI